MATEERRYGRQHPVEPTIRAAIGDEVDRALKKLGAEMPRTGISEPADLYDALRKNGGLPPMKWSSIRYGFEPIEERPNGQETAYSGRDCCEAASG